MERAVSWFGWTTIWIAAMAVLILSMLFLRSADRLCQTIEVGTRQMLTGNVEGGR